MKSLLLLLLCIHLQFTTSIRFNFHQSSSSHPDIDPYATLSLPPSATPSQIQKAYRLKARQTHPDKNPSPTANEEFRVVSEAFDILSDPNKKRAYDAKLRRIKQMEEEQNRREQQRRRAEQMERSRFLMKQRDLIRKAKAGIEYVMKWSKVSQLREYMDGDTSSRSSVYNTNILIMFVGNKAAEKKGEEEYFFPYPFVGRDESAVNSNVLVVAKVRYNSPTLLTQQFQAPRTSDNPHFIFAKEGDPLHKYHIFHPKKNRGILDLHEDWKHWVQSLLQIRGVIINRHPLPMTIFILRDDKIVHIHNHLATNFEIELSFHPGDRILVFDERLDNFPGGRRQHNDKILRHASSIAVLDTIVTSEREYEIPHTNCYDLSTQCYEWAMSRRGRKSQCHNNPEFMHHICPYTCEVCSEGMLSGIKYVLFHYPGHLIHMPPLLSGLTRIVQVFLDGMAGIAQMSLISMAVLLVLGLLLGFNIAFFGSATTSTGSAGSNRESKSILTTSDRLVLVSSICICCGAKAFLSTRRDLIPRGLRTFHSDLTTVASDPELYVVLAIAGVILYVYAKTVLSFMMKDDVHNKDIAFFTVIVVLFIAAGLGFIFFIVKKDSDSALKWSLLWGFQKNAAFAFVALGSHVGASFTPLRKLSTHIDNIDIAILVIPNLFVLGGIVCLSEFDSRIYSDLERTVTTHTIGTVALVFCGMVGGLLYMKMIHLLAGDADTEGVTKVKTPDEETKSADERQHNKKSELPEGPSSQLKLQVTSFEKGNIGLTTTDCNKYGIVVPVYVFPIPIHDLPINYYC